MLTNSYDGQEYLIAMMALLKERTDIVYENKKGIYHGLAMMALQAFLCGELQKFNQRLDDIYYLHQANINLKNELIRIQARIVRRRILSNQGKKVVLTREEQKIMDIWAFFDGIVLYQAPKIREEIFGKPLTQRPSTNVAYYKFQSITRSRTE